jgi:hypothetical protein
MSVYLENVIIDEGLQVNAARPLCKSSGVSA